MTKKITSYNQSGGITAEKVTAEGNIGVANHQNNVINPTRRKITFLHWITILAAIATIVTCIIETLLLFKK